MEVVEGNKLRPVLPSRDDVFAGIEIHPLDHPWLQLVVASKAMPRGSSKFLVNQINCLLIGKPVYTST